MTCDRKIFAAWLRRRRSFLRDLTTEIVADPDPQFSVVRYRFKHKSNDQSVSMSFGRYDGKYLAGVFNVPYDEEAKRGSTVERLIGKTRPLDDRLPLAQATLDNILRRD